MKLPWTRRGHATVAVDSSTVGGHVIAIAGVTGNVAVTSVAGVSQQRYWCEPFR